MLRYFYGKVIFLVLGLAFIPLFHAAHCQEILKDSTEKATEIVAIPLALVGPQTEKTLTTLRDIKNKIQSTKLDLQIDSLVPEKLTSFEKVKESFDLADMEYMSQRQTESLKNDLMQRRMQFDTWRSSYTMRLEQINELKGILGGLKATWELTLNLTRTEKLPPTVKERISSTLAEINDLVDSLISLSNQLLTRQDKLTEELIYIDEVFDAIASKEKTFRTRIFSVSSPPIWYLYRDIDLKSGLQQRLVSIFRGHAMDFRLFIQNYKDSIIMHSILFVVFLFSLYYLKSDVAKWSDEKKDEVVKTSLYIISKPFSAALIITLSLARLVYPEAPGNVLNFFTALLALPILTIVPGLIGGIKKKYFYIIGGIFILSQLADYFSDLVIIERIILLFLDLVTIALLVSIFRSKQKISIANPKIKWGFVFTVMRICVFLLSLSIVANMTGSMVLSRLLSRGSLVMIYGGGIIYACTIILRGLFALMLQHNLIAGLNLIQNNGDIVKKRTFQIIKWTAIYYWIYVTFSAFMIYDPLYQWVSAGLSTEWAIGSIELSLGSILAFFITLWISLLISKFIRFILQDEILTHFALPRGVPGAISMLVRLALIGIGFILAFGAAKIDISNIAIVFGALGVGIGFGLQNIFNNLVSGLILAFERPIQVGDVIQISTLDLMGIVKEIGIRASVVRTFDGAEVIVPNGNLISNEMINWTLSDNIKRQEIIVGVTYGTDTKKVLEILDQLLAGLENVLKNPAHIVLFLGFGESSLDFRVLFWTHFDHGISTKSAFGLAIDEAFKKAGIEIPFPQRDLHLRSVSEKVDFSQSAITDVPKPQQREKADRTIDDESVEE